MIFEENVSTVIACDPDAPEPAAKLGEFLGVPIIENSWSPTRFPKRCVDIALYAAGALYMTSSPQSDGGDKGIGDARAEEAMAMRKLNRSQALSHFG